MFKLTLIVDELVTVEPIQTNNNRKEQLDHSTTFLFFYDKKHVFSKKKRKSQNSLSSRSHGYRPFGGDGRLVHATLPGQMPPNASTGRPQTKTFF